MESVIPPIVIDHDLDEDTVEELQNLRSVRAGLAHKMLVNLENTAAELKRRGLMEDVDTDELRKELLLRCKSLDVRLEGPEVIYPDELSIYVDLIPDEITAQ